MKKRSNWFLSILSKPLGRNILIALFFLSIFIFQIIHLDGDSSPLKKIGDIGDEGYWVHNARSQVLFGNALPDELNQSLVGATLFNYLLVATFKIMGVSLFSARFLSLLSLWGVLILLYSLINKYYNRKMAIFSVLFLGLMNEVLMYAKWATPILLEVFFLVLLIYFFDLGQSKRNRALIFLAGVCYPLALFSKLSSIYFALPLIIFIVLLSVARKIDFKEVLSFIFGAFTAVLFYLVTFAIHNIEQIKFFIASIGRVSAPATTLAQTADHFASSIWKILTYEFFTYPSLCILSIILLFYVYEIIRNNRKNKITDLIKSFNIIELYSLSWFFGMLIAIATSFDQSDRRFVMLIFPLTILAISFISSKYKQKDTESSSISKLFIFALSFVIIGVYLNVGFTKIGTSMFQFIAPRYEMIGYGLSFVLALYLSFLIILRNNKRTFVYALISIFFLTNITLDTIWYAFDRHTLARETKKIDALISQMNVKSIYVTGGDAHFLAINSKYMQPVWYLKNPIGRMPINGNFFDGKKDFLVLEIESYDGLRVDPSTDLYLRASDFQSAQKIAELHLYPRPINNEIYRFDSNVFLVSEKR